MISIRHYQCHSLNDNPSPHPISHLEPPVCSDHGVYHTVDALHRRENWVMVDLALEFCASGLSITFLSNIIPTFPDSEPFNIPTSFLYPSKTLCFPYSQCHYCGVAHRITKLEDGFELTFFIQLLTVCRLGEAKQGVQSQQTCQRKKA